MEVNYRIVEEITQGGGWKTVGVIVHWTEAPAHMQLRGMLQHTISRSIWRKIRQRVKEQQLTLTTYHEAIQEYSLNYRILPETHRLIAPTATEIKQQLREKYVFSREPISVSSS